MINKFKIGLLALIMAFGLMGIASTASAANLTWGADGVVDLSSPDIDLTITSGSTATALVVNTDSIVVTVDNGETFTFTSPNDLGISPVIGPSISMTCSQAAVQTVVITGGSSSQAFTITPTSSACVPGMGGGGGSGGGSGGSGGGGGGSTPPPVTPAVPATPATPATPVSTIPGCTGNNGYSTVTGQACVTVPATPATPATPASPSSSGMGKITKAIAMGARNSDVKTLQTFLKALGKDIYPSGIVSGYYGSLTKAAVAKFQLKYGIVTGPTTPGYGRVGPKTMAKINELMK